MERQRPRSERARRNRYNASFLMQRRGNPQHRLKLIDERHLSLKEEPPLQSQTELSKNNEPNQLDS
jgi:hypothetical protein